jgi:hypothetical protein
MQADDSAPTANVDTPSWYAFALAAMVGHLLLVGICWFDSSWLGLPLLAPGFLVQALLDQPKPRNGYNLRIIATSTLFFGALGVLFRAQPKLAAVIACIAVVGGFGVIMGHVVRAFGGP